MQTDYHSRNKSLSKALRYFREGDPIPPGRDLRVADDRGSIRAVLYLLLRPWPYIRPQVYGRWWLPGHGVENGVAEAVAGRGYGFGYVPPETQTGSLALPPIEQGVSFRQVGRGVRTGRGHHLRTADSNVAKEG